MIWSAASFLLTLVCSYVLIGRAARWGILDAPGERKVHVLPTPRTGGLGLVLGFALTWCFRLALHHPWPAIPWQTFLAGLGFVALGALDDRFGFHPRQKIFWFAGFAFLAAWPLAFHGADGSTIEVSLYATTLRLSSWLVFPFLACWFLSVPNAVNIEDAINGYMGGYTLIVLLAGVWLKLDLWVPIGCLIAFLVLNWPRAKHFLGDAGSFGCGFLIAEVVLKMGGLHRPLLALACAAPIAMDVAMGIVRRLRLGMSLFDGDQGTFPHHIIRLCGGSHGWAALLLWANAAILVWFAIQGSGWVVIPLCVYAAALIALNAPILFSSQGSGSLIR